MFLKRVVFPALGGLLLLLPALAGALPNDPCVLPNDLHREIVNKYGDAQLVSLPDLDQYDGELFQKEHGNACPGLVKVDFYGDGLPTFALLLKTSARPTNNTALVVTHYVDEKWTINALETGNPSPYAPVIWTQAPGAYRDVYGKKAIRATNPVIVFCKYESWAILYAWTNHRVAKIWLAD